MLYALQHPLALVGLLLGFLVGIVARGMVMSALARRWRDGTATGYGRGGPDPRQHLDPFGAVGAAIGGLGWGRPWPAPVRFRIGRPTRPALVLLAGPLTLAACAAAVLALTVPAGLSRPDFAGVDVASVSHGGGTVFGRPLLTILLSAGVQLLGMAILDCIPLPPLDGGRLLLLLAPRTLAWQKAEYWLEDRNIGLVAVLVLLVFPLGGSVPLLLYVVSLIGNALLGAVAG